MNRHAKLSAIIGLTVSAALLYGAVIGMFMGAPLRLVAWVALLASTIAAATALTMNILNGIGRNDRPDLRGGDQP